jgi:uncharacterized protein (TIGR03790 family)
MINQVRILGLLSAIAFTLPAWAGESGLNVIVVVNQNTTESIQLGNEYCQLRGVPPQNFFRMTGWTGGNIEWEQSDFDTNLLNPLLTYVNSLKLTNQIQIVLLSMDIPYRVYNGASENSTTSALFYGFKTNGSIPPGDPGAITCSEPADSTNSFAYSELPFFLATPNTATTNSFLAMMLTDSNLDLAESTLQRGVSSDSTFPAEPVYLEETSDFVRNVRFPQFDNAIQECRVRGDESLARINSNVTAVTNALGLETGLNTFLPPANPYVPGAIADNLTSFSGAIFENSGQTPILVFLEGGAAGSYGSVVEPCNITNKFPNPMVYFYQNRGFSLAEAYYQSVANPFEGLMVGEPLSAPFARRGSGSWNAPASGSVLSGSAAINISFTAANTNLPLAQVDLFVDGAFVQTVTNLPPSPGNILSVTIGGVASKYTVAHGDTLASAAIGLASVINSVTNQTGVNAVAVGDRLVLRSQLLSSLGTTISAQAGQTIGSAAALTTFAAAALPSFLDNPSSYGTHYVQTGPNNPNVGDWVQMTIIKTNGLVVTESLTNMQSGQSIMPFLQTLVNQINDDPNLQGFDGMNAFDLAYENNGDYGFLINANSPGWPAAQIQTIFTASADLDATPAGMYALEDNLPDLQPRDQIYLSSGGVSLPARFNFQTTNFADGFHQLTAVAYEGTSVRTQTQLTETAQFSNSPLSANISALGADTNGNLLFGITANASDIAQTQLFSTGGVISETNNKPSAVLAGWASTLGVGLHPFYAVVTDSNGHHYQTQTIWEQLPPTGLYWTPPSPIAYGTALSSNQLNATADIPGTFAYNPIAGTVPDAGTYSLTVVFAPSNQVEYGSVTNTVSLIVSPAPLTVTAASFSRPYETTNPVFTGTISGLTNGDNITATYSCAATASSPPGTYAIVPTLVDPHDRQTNYTVTSVDGALTVTSTQPVIESVTQSGNVFAFTWSAKAGQMYQIQTTTNLNQGNWTDLGAPVVATNTSTTTTNSITNSQLFCRVVVAP